MQVFPKPPTPNSKHTIRQNTVSTTLLTLDSKRDQDSSSSEPDFDGSDRVIKFSSSDCYSGKIIKNRVGFLVEDDGKEEDDGRNSNADNGYRSEIDKTSIGKITIDRNFVEDTMSADLRSFLSTASSEEKLKMKTADMEASRKDGTNKPHFITDIHIMETGGVKNSCAANHRNNDSRSLISDMTLESTNCGSNLKDHDNRGRKRPRDKKISASFECLGCTRIQKCSIVMVVTSVVVVLVLVAANLVFKHFFIMV